MSEFTFIFKVWKEKDLVCSEQVENAIRAALNKVQEKHSNIAPLSLQLNHIEVEHRQQPIAGLTSYRARVTTADPINYDHLHQIWKEKFIIEAQNLDLLPNYEYAFCFTEWSTMCNGCVGRVKNSIKAGLKEVGKSAPFPKNFVIKNNIDYKHDPKKIEAPVYYYATVYTSNKLNENRKTRIGQIWNKQYINEAEDLGLLPTRESIKNTILEDPKSYLNKILACAVALASCTITFFFLPHSVCIMAIISLSSTLFGAWQFLQKCWQGKFIGSDIMSQLMSLGILLSYVNISYVVSRSFTGAITISFPIAIMTFMLPISLIMMANFTNYIMLKIKHHRYALIEKIHSNKKDIDYYDVYSKVADAKVASSNCEDTIMHIRKHKMEIKSGDIVKLDPNEIAPANGTVIDFDIETNREGIYSNDILASCNTSIKDGETQRIIKYKDKIPAGTVNNSLQPLYLKIAEKEAKEKEEKQGKKKIIWDEEQLADAKLRSFCNSPQANQQGSEYFLTRNYKYLLLGYFISLIILIILSSCLLAPHITISTILTNVTNILFSICPCAISIALSYPNIALLSKLNQYFDIKETATLSRLNKIGIIIFDKTGTLTQQSSVESFYSTKEKEFRQLWLAVAAAELNELNAAHSKGNKAHPIARGIYDFIQRNFVVGADFPQAETIITKSNGISAIVQGKKIHIGNRSFIKQYCATIPEDYLREIKASQSLTPVYVAQSDINSPNSSNVIGIFFLQNEIRPNVKVTLRKLNQLKCDLYLLSGDTEGALNSFVKKNGLHGIFADIKTAGTPQDKQNYIISLIEANKNPEKNLFYAGDGFNDAPAMHTIQINSKGIAIALGQDNPAAQVADIILKRPNLCDIYRLLQLKGIDKDIDCIIKQNLLSILFFLTWIAIFVVTTAIISLAISPTLMVILMLCSTLSIYLNAKRSHFIVDNRMGYGGAITKFLASPYFFATFILAASLVFASLQAQLIMTSHLAVIAFTTTSSIVTSACLLAGVSILGACLILLAFEYCYNYCHKSSYNDRLESHKSNKDMNCLPNMMKYLGIFSKTRQRNQQSDEPIWREQTYPVVI